MHIDPDGRHVGRAVQAIAALDGQQLKVASAALCVYGALFLTEGTGRVLRRRWAECFTVVVTGSFIPLELYEIARRPDAIRAAVCFINVAIVWYLARGLRRRNDDGPVQPGAPASQPERQAQPERADDDRICFDQGVEATQSVARWPTLTTVVAASHSPSTR